MTTFDAPTLSRISMHQRISSPGHYQSYHPGRAIKSCLECRRRKMRCSRTQPCQNCNRFSRDCVFLSAPAWSSSPSSDAKEDIVLRPTKSTDNLQYEAWSASEIRKNDGRVRQQMAWDGPEIDSDPVAKLGGFETFDTDNDRPDMGLQIGRLKICERMGGLFRPQIAKKIANLLRQNNDFVPSYNLGPQIATTSSQRPHHSMSSTESSKSQHGTSITPSNGLHSSNPQYLDQNWEDFLSSQHEINFLYYQYFAAVDPITHIIHKPSFDLAFYSVSFYSQNAGSTPPSFKALLLAICLAAAVALSPTQSEMRLGMPKQKLVAKLKSATEKALVDAKYMSSVKLQTLQAFTIYLIPQCCEDVLRSRTVLVGALIRLAEYAGLHRVIHSSSMNPVETQVRRLLWHQICCLGFRTAGTYGPQPTIRDGESHTSLPLNINDADLEGFPHIEVPNNIWTDATFSLIRYECYLVNQLTFKQRVLIDNKTTSLKAARALIDLRKKQIENKYLRHLDERIPIQRCAKLVGRLLTATFDTMLIYSHLQDDQNSDAQHELLNSLLTSSLIITSTAITLETSPSLSLWAWHAGNYQQYHSALFLLMEVYRNPQIPYADRINAILDFVFGNPASHGLGSSRARNHHVLRILDRELNMREGRELNKRDGKKGEDTMLAPLEIEKPGRPRLAKRKDITSAPHSQPQHQQEMDVDRSQSQVPFYEWQHQQQQQLMMVHYPPLTPTQTQNSTVPDVGMSDWGSYCSPMIWNEQLWPDNGLQAF